MTWKLPKLGWSMGAYLQSRFVITAITHSITHLNPGGIFLPAFVMWSWCSIAMVGHQERPSTGKLKPQEFNTQQSNVDAFLWRGPVSFHHYTKLRESQSEKAGPIACCIQRSREQAKGAAKTGPELSYNIFHEQVRTTWKQKSTRLDSCQGAMHPKSSLTWLFLLASCCIAEAARIAVSR